jgi:lysophospholipase L1-like esterase
MKKYFQDKGIYFFFNVVIFSIALLLLTLLFRYRSSSPFIFQYSFKYLAYLVFLVVSAAIFFISILVKGRTFNRNLFFVVILIFLTAQSIPSRLIPQGPIKSTTAEIDHYPVPYLMFSGKPNGRAMYTDETGRRSEVKLNHLGFRVEGPLEKEKPEGEKRIFVLGGSTVYNGYPLFRSIPAQIEQILNKDGYTNVKVYNFGIGSGNSGQELAAILYVVVDYNPDLVVVYDGGNDVFLPYSYDARPGYPTNFFVYERGLDFMKNKLTMPQLLLSMLNRSRLISFMLPDLLEYRYLAINRIRKDVNYRSREWKDAVALKYIGHLEKMCRLAEGFDFKLMVFLQPLVYFKSPLMGREKDLLIGAEFQDYIQYQYKKISSVFNELSTRYNKGGRCFFFDLSHVFSDYNKEVFKGDFIHITDEGNNFIARKICDSIEENHVLNK